MLSLTIIILMIVGCFGAVGSQLEQESEIENNCGCGANSVSTDMDNSVHYLGELVYATPSPPGKEIAGMAPSSWDWRNAEHNEITGDWTTPVKNQGNCGSCYAFGAYGAMEACLDIRDGNPNRNIDLSEQYMVSCGSGGIMGCDGAYADATFAFIENSGALPETCFPYTSGSSGNVPPCSDKCQDWQGKVIEVDDCAHIQVSQESIKNAIVTYGPVSASFEVFEDFYGGGVYVHTSGQSLGFHRIAIVGYNDNNNPGYWICKNSWGAGWGNNGYFYIAYGECDIEEEVYYIDVGDAQTFTPSGAWTACPVASGSMADTIDSNLNTKVTLTEDEGTSCMMAWWWPDAHDLIKFEMYCYGWATLEQTHILSVWKKTTPYSGDAWAGMVLVHNTATACPSDTWTNILQGHTPEDCYGIGIIIWINEDFWYNPELKEVLATADDPQNPPINSPPNKPNRPSGETNGKPGVEYSYTTSTTDPDGDQVYYWFDWGDGANSGWIGPYGSGSTGSAKHAWTAKNTYSIKVKAKDTEGAESSWSDSLSVTMPKSRFVMSLPFAFA